MPRCDRRLEIAIQYRENRRAELKQQRIVDRFRDRVRIQFMDSQHHLQRSRYYTSTSSKTRTEEREIDERRAALRQNVPHLAFEQLRHVLIQRIQRQQARHQRDHRGNELALFFTRLAERRRRRRSLHCVEQRAQFLHQLRQTALLLSSQRHKAVQSAFQRPHRVE